MHACTGRNVTLITDVASTALRREEGHTPLGCSGRTILRGEQCNGFAYGDHSQRLCKHGDYATVEESDALRAVRVTPRTVLRRAEVNMFPLPSDNCKRLGSATYGEVTQPPRSAVKSHTRNA
jgi:hypothetical protein